MISLTALANAAGACSPKAAPPSPLHVDVSGCETVRRTDAHGATLVCEVESTREVRVVVDDPDDKTTRFEALGRALAPLRADPVERATRFALRVPDGATAVRVVAQRGAAITETTIAVAPSGKPEWLTRALAARRSGALDEAEAVARDHLRDDPSAAAFARGLLARIAFTREDYRSAIDGLRQSWAMHRAAGHLSDAADDAMALAFTLTDRQPSYAAAREVLDALEPTLADLPDARASFAYYASRLAYATGDLRKNLELIADSERRTQRLGLDAAYHEARLARAMTSYDLGRFGESCRVQREIIAQPEDVPCNALLWHTNLAVVAQTALRSGGAVEGCPADPIPVLEEGLRASGNCKDATASANAWIILAREHALAGRVADAKAALARALASTPDPVPHLAVGLTLAQAELALAEHDTDRAIERFRASEQAAALAGYVAEEIRGVLGGARARIVRGDVAAGLREYARADVLLDDATARVPLGVGRGSFVGAMEQWDQTRLRVLVDGGRYGEALDVVFAERARRVHDLAVPAAVEHLRGDARRRWDEAAGTYAARRAEIERGIAKAWALSERDRAAQVEALQDDQRRALAALTRTLRELATIAERPAPLDPRALDDHTLLLAYEPFEGGYLGLAASHRGVVGKRIARPADDDGRALLAPFDELVMKATRIRVLLPPALGALDFHAIPWREEPGGRDTARAPVLPAREPGGRKTARAPVLPAREPGGRKTARAPVLPAREPLAAHAAVEYVLAGAVPRTPANPPKARLVVGDPTGDLPGARAEARWVAGAFTSSGRGVSLLVQSDATSARVHEALGDVDLLHYAGHALHDRESAWGAALSLYRTDRIEIADVLAAPRVPRVVVLAACEGAKQVGDALGIAHAFVLAGAGAVVAPTRPVGDATSLAFAQRFYARWDGTTEGVAEAMRIATLDARARDGSTDWSAYRAFTP